MAAHPVQPRPLGDIVNSGNFASPLAQLSLAAAGNQLVEGSSTSQDGGGVGGPSNNARAGPSVPAIDFNLFRSPSIYSVDSLASLSTISADEHAFNPSPPESPSTPKASRQNPQRFPLNDPKQSPSPTRSGPSHRLTRSQDYVLPYHADRQPQLLPKRSFVVRTKVGEPEAPNIPLNARPQFGRSRTAQPSSSGNNSNGVEPFGRDGSDPQFDVTSLHGEQGADWGEDEAQFEWLDRDEPEAMNGDGRQYGYSPTKRFGKLKAAMKGDGHGSGGHGLHGLVGHGHGQKEEGQKLKKPLVFPRRAPPPPPGVQPHPHSPRVPSAPSPVISHPKSLRAQGSHGHLTVPGASGDPKRPGLANKRAETDRPIPSSDAFWSSPSSSPASTPRLGGSPTLPPPKQRPPHAPLPPKIMVPMKDMDGPNGNLGVGIGNDGENRHSQMSFQSAAYSFYDLESPGPSTPRATTPNPPSTAENDSIASSTASGAASTESIPTSATSSNSHRDLAFPKGTYHKVSVSKLERDRTLRERINSDSTLAGSSGRSGSTSGMETDEGQGAEYYLAKGIEARGKGDLPRSAWYFKTAAEQGSSTGRMYWGLALRHGWGIAKDNKRAFAELRQACDASLAEGGISFYQSPGTVKLSLQQKKNMTRDVSLGMFEIANCFLEGVGVKKAPDIAMAYLRFAGNLGDLAAQEQLGFLLSKGGNGVKKDMKEAAKWYRMAIGQGSTNTFGLAWVWKDKYMN